MEENTQLPIAEPIWRHTSDGRYVEVQSQCAQRLDRSCLRNAENVALQKHVCNSLISCVAGPTEDRCVPNARSCACTIGLRAICTPLGLVSQGAVLSQARGAEPQTSAQRGAARRVV